MKTLLRAAVCAALALTPLTATAQIDGNTPLPAPISPKPGGWAPKGTDDPNGVYQRTTKSPEANRKAVIGYAVLGTLIGGAVLAFFIRDTRSALARRPKQPWDV